MATLNASASSLAQGRSVYDPIDIQSQELEKFAQMNVNSDELASPVSVQYLVSNVNRLLAEVRTRDEEIRVLRSENADLRSERENLRVQIATAEQRYSIGWIEILISYLGGYAINILSNDIKSFLGWFLVVVSISVVIAIRFSLGSFKPATVAQSNSSKEG